jgi:hypothetical protein
VVLQLNTNDLENVAASILINHFHFLIFIQVTCTHGNCCITAIVSFHPSMPVIFFNVNNQQIVACNFVILDKNVLMHLQEKRIKFPGVVFMKGLILGHFWIAASRWSSYPRF